MGLFLCLPCRQGPRLTSKARGFGNLQIGKGEVINCGAMHISPVRTDENNLKKANPIQLVEGL